MAEPGTGAAAFTRDSRNRRHGVSSPPYSLAMRESFHAELDSLISDLARAARLAGDMMTNASTALNQADLALAEHVISGAGEMAVLCDDMDQLCVKLLVLQAPVATDLRVVVATMHAVGDVERMCHLAQHIAKIARMRHPAMPIPDALRPVFARMGLLASALAHDAAAAIEGRDPLSAQRLAQADDEVDALRRRVFQILFAEHWSHGIEPAVDAALIGRYYERFADHAVAIAGQVNFIVTGLPPER
ncbi:MAG TPA: phosphate signaling complex protein PhoU [Pseudonocardiaceae bacterium]|nr:phosphate signaling complex protein PhoU [Pseudonocardiaceae bacterium]